jgi:hypothetical protein
MSLLTIDDLKTLVEQPHGVCVSIYMPTYAAGTETRQNAIRFKNLLKQAAAKLAELDIPHSSALLQPALELDEEDWQHQDIGFALFLTEGFFRAFRVPLTFPELVVVNEQFHLKPLIPLLTRDSEFYILALSQKQVRFFEATRYRIQPVEIEGLPKSMDDALQYDETAKAGQFRISTSKGGTSNTFTHAGSFHGQGSPDQDDNRQNILQYFYLIDHALHNFLHDKQSPLILIGVEYLLPLYHEANTYPHLLEAGVTENPEIYKPETLHAQVFPILEPYFSQAEQAAIEHYREMAGTGKASADLQETIPATYYGRVEQLLVAVGVQQWGSFDPQAMALQLHAEAEPGDEDLLNAAAIQTLLNGGQVYAMEPDKVPDAAPLAAVFRY